MFQISSPTLMTSQLHIFSFFELSEWLLIFPISAPSRKPLTLWVGSSPSLKSNEIWGITFHKIKSWFDGFIYNLMVGPPPILFKLVRSNTIKFNCLWFFHNNSWRPHYCIFHNHNAFLISGLNIQKSISI